jgi:molybdopterin synthase catalytic subunit
MITVRIQRERFDAGAELLPLAALGGGALASFTGIARNDANDAGDVAAIELEHYPAMTLAALQALAAQAQNRWSLLGCVLIHRVGIIPVGEEIVLVGTASLHRAAALEATAFLIDRLKTGAPFWKKEHRSDGSKVWVEAKISDDIAAEKWQD